MGDETKRLNDRLKAIEDRLDAIEKQTRDSAINVTIAKDEAQPSTSANYLPLSMWGDCDEG